MTRTQVQTLAGVSARALRPLGFRRLAVRGSPHLHINGPRERRGTRRAPGLPSPAPAASPAGVGARGPAFRASLGSWPWARMWSWVLPLRSQISAFIALLFKMESSVLPHLVCGLATCHAVCAAWPVLSPGICRCSALDIFPDSPPLPYAAGAGGLAAQRGGGPPDAAARPGSAGCPGHGEADRAQPQGTGARPAPTAPQRGLRTHVFRV